MSDNAQVGARGDLLAYYKDCQPEIVRFLIHKLKSVFAAEDVAQELYIKICRFDAVTPVSNPRSYLFKMAANLAIDHQRSETRRSEILEDVKPMEIDIPTAPSPESTLLSEQSVIALQECLSKMPVIKRKIFYLNRFEHKSHREIAEIVGLSPSAVFKHLRSVVDKLAEINDANQYK